MKQSTSFTNAEDSAATADAPGASAVAVPSLAGVEPQAALDRVREVGLVPAVESQEVDDEGLVGVVCQQHPDAGTELPHGGVVLLLIGQLSVTEDLASTAAPEPVEEDDWFDIELPGVDESFRGSPSGGREGRDVQTAAAMSQGPEGVPAGPAESRRPQRRAVVTGAIALALFALVAVTLRSCGERDAAVPSSTIGAQHERTVTGQTPERHSRRPVRPVGSTRAQHPFRQRTTRRRAAPLPHVQPLRVGSVPEPPPSPEAPPPSVSDHCEFCPEGLSP